MRSFERLKAMFGISVIVALESPLRSKHGQEINSRTRSKISKELDESFEIITHRWPDSRGQWISEDDRVGS